MGEKGPLHRWQRSAGGSGALQRHRRPGNAVQICAAHAMQPLHKTSKSHTPQLCLLASVSVATD